jgi:hypothetical protein
MDISLFLFLLRLIQIFVILEEQIYLNNICGFSFLFLEAPGPPSGRSPEAGDVLALTDLTVYTAMSQYVL